MSAERARYGVGHGGVEIGGCGRRRGDADLEPVVFLATETVRRGGLHHHTATTPLELLQNVGLPSEARVTRTVLAVGSLRVPVREFLSNERDRGPTAHRGRKLLGDQRHCVRVPYQKRVVDGPLRDAKLLDKVATHRP